MLRDVLFIGHEMARAIQYLAANKIVHRDIRPANIMITVKGEAKLLDFGLSKHQREDTQIITHDLVCPTPFSAPEYVTGSTSVTVQADIFSLGASLYFAATGKLIWGEVDAPSPRSPTPVKPLPMRTLLPNADPTLASLIDRMLSLQPADRPSIDEVVTELALQMRRTRRQNEVI